MFGTEFAPLESAVKYFKEEKGLIYHEIAVLLRRDDRTIWKTYDNCLKKSRKPFAVSKSRYPIPVDILADEEISILEAICNYLKESCGLSVREISCILNKKTPTIWTALARRRKKNEKL